MDGMKSNPDFAAISAVLKENLDLVGSPVAVKIVTAPEQIPAGVPEIEETVRHCRMISLARLLPVRERSSMRPMQSTSAAAVPGLLVFARRVRH